MIQEFDNYKTYIWHCPKCNRVVVEPYGEPEEKEDSMKCCGKTMMLLMSDGSWC